MDKKIKVIKRDGNLEDFNQDNVATVVKAAGLNDADAKTLAAKINTWLMSLNETSVSSLKIRDRVQEELKLVNENAANLYAWYQTTKEEQTPEDN
jgi:transcriptional regulator NrdR family protein